MSPNLNLKIVVPLPKTWTLQHVPTDCNRIFFDPRNRKEGRNRF